MVHSTALTRIYPPKIAGSSKMVCSAGPPLAVSCSKGRAVVGDTQVGLTLWGGVVLYVKRGLGMCQCRDTVASDAKG